MSRVLVVGVPRSGTTWVGKVLGRTPGASYLNEPDNEYELFALRAKANLGLFPVLASEDRAPLYEELWDAAFVDGRAPAVRDAIARIRMRTAKALDTRTESDRRMRPGDRTSTRVRLASALALPRRSGATEHKVVKSVHCLLALEWITRRWHPNVVVVARHPLNTISSWLRINLKAQDRRLDEHPRVLERYVRPWGVPLPAAGASQLARSAWHLGLLTAALHEAVDRNPGWILSVHEDLCLDPVRRLESLAGRAGLAWSSATAAWIDESNRAGDGFETHRVSTDQPEQWRKRLSPAQVEEIRAVLNQFPLRGWPHHEGAGLAR